jgi:hypothetical protein
VSELTKLVKKEKSERILTFDLLRGYFLAVILFNHLEYYPSGLELFTGKSILYVSTAEGFFAVSGIVLGIVRGRKLINQPLSTAIKLLWKRAFQLYLTSIVLTLLFTIVGQFFLNNPGLKYGIYTDWSNWADLVWQTITLHYTYGWADFLRMYAVFLFFTPLAVWLLRKGWWYIVLTLSLLVWSLYPFFASDVATAQLFSWQLIFFGGFVIGFYWQDIIAQWRKLTINTRRLIGWSFVSAFAVTVLATSILVFSQWSSIPFSEQLTAWHHIIEQGFEKDRLPLPRILLGIIWFWGAFYLFRRFESWIMKYLGWLLLPLGTHSLYVYTLSAFVVFFAHLLIAAPGFNSLLLNLIASLLCLAIVLTAVKTKFLMKIIPR